jgi:hypothetical protein
VNKKMMTIALLLLGLGAIGYATYNNFSQLRDIDYDLFETDEEEEND